MEKDNVRIAFKNIVFGSSSIVLRLFSGSIVFFTVARLESVEVSDFGQLTYAISLSSLFIIVSSYGLTHYLVREIAADPSLLKSHARTSFSIRLIASSVSFAILIGFITVVGLEDRSQLIVAAVGLAFFVGAFSVDIYALFHSQERMHFELAGVAIENGLLLVFILITYWTGTGITGVVIAFLVAKLGGFVFNYLLCGVTTVWVYPSLNVPHWRKVVIDASPFAITSFITLGIIQVDTVLLRSLAPGDTEAAVGLYQSAYRLLLVPLLLPQLVMTVFLAQFSRMHGSKGPRLATDLRRVNHVLMTLGVVVGLVVVLRGSEIITVFYGDKYAEGGAVFQILGFTMMLRFGSAYNLYLTISNRVNLRVIFGSITLAALIGLDFLLIPKYGALGAAYASVIAHVIYWLPFLIVLRQKEGMALLGWKLKRAIAVAVLAGGLLFVTADVKFLFIAPVYAVLGLVAVYMTMPSEDRAGLMAQLKKRSS